jgi:uncharacterized protein
MGVLALSQTAWLAALLAVAGACSGVLAGLFGVGGGTVMVPVLYEVFSLYGVPDDVLMPLCVGTSLAVIVPTSISSFIGHYKKGAVDVDVLKVWALPHSACSAAFSQPPWQGLSCSRPSSSSSAFFSQ